MVLLLVLNIITLKLSIMNRYNFVSKAQNHLCGPCGNLVKSLELRERFVEEISRWRLSIQGYYRVELMYVLILSIFLYKRLVSREIFRPDPFDT